MIECFLLRFGRAGLVAILFLSACSNLSQGGSGAPSAKATAPSSTNKWPVFTLGAEASWQLNLPRGERFDASGLAFTADGRLLTVNDREHHLYSIQFLAETNAANLLKLPDCFTSAQLAQFQAEKIDRYDTEGVATDAEGRLYICEEANRWIMRFDPKTKAVERLEIDWAPVRKYFHPTDRNSSFEGVAVGPGMLYVANERLVPRIIAVDLKTLKVVDDFQVIPSTHLWGETHYSDLSWFGGALYILCRHDRAVLKVNPATHQILAEYSYKDIENAPENVYRSIYPTGTMEGLAVDAKFIWLATDNNGEPRLKHPKDTRPTLFKCPRPDLAP